MNIQFSKEDKKFLVLYHNDFVVDKILNIKVDGTELSSYKWINLDELSSDSNYVKIIEQRYKNKIELYQFASVLL